MSLRRAQRSVLLVTALLAFACRNSEQRSEPGEVLLAPSGSASSTLEPLLGTPPIPPPTDCAEPPSDALRLESGVATRVLRTGTGSERATDNDVVALEHTVWKRDGTFVESTKLTGQPMVQPLHTLVPPVREVVAQMTVGETRLAWLPEHGATGGAAGSKPATVELTLLRLVEAPAAPRDLRAPPPGAKRTPSGLGYQLLSKGHGPQASAEASVEILHTVWSSDGRVAESTAMAKTPALYGPRDLLPGLREGVALMHVGDKMRFWVPSQLAYGDHPRQGRPAGALVAEVELLAVR